MLLTITNTKAPATNLGYLLHKNPSWVQSFELSFGKAYVFYPEQPRVAARLRSYSTLIRSGSCALEEGLRAKGEC